MAHLSLMDIGARDRAVEVGAQPARRPPAHRHLRGDPQAEQEPCRNQPDADTHAHRNARAAEPCASRRAPIFPGCRLIFQQPLDEPGRLLRRALLESGVVQLRADHLARGVGSGHRAVVAHRRPASIVGILHRRLVRHGRRAAGAEQRHTYLPAVRLFGAVPVGFPALPLILGFFEGGVLLLAAFQIVRGVREHDRRALRSAPRSSSALRR